MATHLSFSSVNLSGNSLPNISLNVGDHDALIDVLLVLLGSTGHWGKFHLGKESSGWQGIGMQIRAVAERLGLLQWQRGQMILAGMGSMSLLLLSRRIRTQSVGITDLTWLTPLSQKADPFYSLLASPAG